MALRQTKYRREVAMICYDALRQVKFEGVEDMNVTWTESAEMVMRIAGPHSSTFIKIRISEML